MKIVQSGKKRKAISPVLATVILIAITLIAAIAVAGFVFGLFGTFTSSATLTINSATVSCTVPTLAGVSTCTMDVVNTGSGSTSITSAGPATGLGVTFAMAGPISIPANSAGVNITLTSAHASPGQVASGYLVVTSGANLGFSVTFPVS
ncbi:MAG: archaellin/type IV pilin N-terminal domain-containing protein [Nitrososphaerales archaeon]|jgi:flagellin-like protein